MRRIIALTIKEFLALLKDTRSRTVIVVPPILQLIVFGYAATYDLARVRYALYNEDHGFASRRFVAALRGSPVFSEIATLTSSAPIDSLISDRDVALVVRIGPHFTRDLLAGRPADVQVLVDGRNSNTALLIVGYVGRLAERFNREWHGLPESGRLPGDLRVRSWFNPNLESRWFVVPGIVGLLTLVVSLLVTSLSVAREREAGTFDQLLVTPLTPAHILLGKALPGVVIGLAEASFIVLVAVFWFHVPLRGSLWALYAGLFLFVLSSVGVGLMISSLAVTQQQGLLGAFVFLVPAVILSGFATPIENMPGYLQVLTLLNPLRYFLVIIRGTFLKGGHPGLFMDQYWPMAVIAAVALFAAAMLFRRRIY
jgi:ABC-2 type transport system permease protein